MPTPSNPVTSLDKLDALERRFDGTIPAHLLRAALNPQPPRPPSLAEQIAECDREIAQLMKIVEDGNAFPAIFTMLAGWHEKRRGLVALARARCDAVAPHNESGAAAEATLLRAAE